MEKKRSNLQHKTVVGFNLKSLPDNFAEELLNLELDIEQQDPLELITVTQLIQIYMTAIEFYESQNNQRYIVFKNKIQKLITNPRVIKVMSQGNTTKKQKFTNTLQEKQKQSPSQVESILYNATKREELIQTDMQEQESQLLQRVKSHKKKRKHQKELDKAEINSDNQEKDQQLKQLQNAISKFKIWKHCVFGAMKTVNEDQNINFEEEKQKQVEQRGKSIQMLKHASVELDQMVKRFNETGQDKPPRPKIMDIDKKGLADFKLQFSKSILRNLEQLTIEQQEEKLVNLFSGKFTQQV